MTSQRITGRTRRALAGAAAVAAACCVAAPTARAQRADTTATGVRPRADTSAASRRAGRAPVVDSTPRPPISPKRAFLYSLLVPGMGEAKLGRSGAAAFFGGIEAFSLAMARKSAKDLHIAQRFENDSIFVGYTYTCSEGPSQTDTTAGRTQFGCTLGNGGAFDSTLVFNRYRGGRVGARKLHYEDWLAVLAFNHLISGADAFISAQLWDLPARVALQSGPTGGAALAFRVRW